MNKIILHRGNTLKGVENSYEAINPDISDLNTVGLNFDNTKIIFEVDVIAKYPFIIHHTPDNIVEDVFIVTGNDESIKKKQVWELTERQIKVLNHKSPNTKSKPMILSELLDLAKKNQYKLYLDVKVPTYKWTNVLNYIKLFKDIYTMINLIRKYHDIIDCVLAFSPLALIIFRIYMMFNYKNNNAFDLGLFWYGRFKNTIINKLYLFFLYLIVSPKVISYNLNMIKKDISHINLLESTNNVRFYTWSIHKSKLLSEMQFLIKHKLTPVVDMFD